MTPRDWLAENWWLILWAVVVLAALALTELLPPGQAGRVWLESVHWLP